MTAFPEALAQHVIAAMSRQLALADLIGSRSWEVDIQAGTVRFGSDLSYGIQLLGTESEQDRSWLWAWANTQSNLPPAVLQAAGWLRGYGQQSAIAELVEPMFSLDRADGHQLALLASGLTGRCYYRGPYEGGALFFLLEGVPAEVLAPARPERAVMAITQVLQAFPVDHRTAVQSFLHQQGWRVEEAVDSVTGRHPDGLVLRAVLDQRGRITSLSGDWHG
jgi:Family of unknown function (DUF6882)